MSSSPLWLMLPGASGVVATAWVAWMITAGLAAPALSLALGPAGSVLAILAVGWLFARSGPVPSECLGRFHLDDVELIACGPGNRVRRHAWSEVAVVTQARHVLVLEAHGTRLRLPLTRLVTTAGWSAVLTQVVTGLAADAWELIEDGEVVRLTPQIEPEVHALAWWAYAPALLACVLGSGGAGLGLGLGLVLAERVVAFARRRAGVVELERSGIALRMSGRRRTVSWSEATVTRAPYGLVVAAPGGVAGVISRHLPNFTAVAPVIQTRAELGAYSAPVSFRVRLAGGTLAVVGEVEPSA